MDWHLLRISDFDPSGNPGVPAEPITLDRAKAHLKVEDSADDELIDGLRVVARETAETETNRALVPSRWQLHRSRFPRGRDAIEIPVGDVDPSGVVSIAYVDADGDEAALSEGDYRLVARQNTPSSIEPVDEWPSGATRVVVTFDAGSAGPSARVQAGMLLFLTHLYAHRGDTPDEIPPTVAALWGARIY